MKALLPLLLSATLPAQIGLGLRYGQGTPDFVNDCAFAIPQSYNNYAFGSQHIGGQFDYLCVRRDQCPTDLAFFHICVIGASPVQQSIPQSITGTFASDLLVSPDVVVLGTLNQTGVEYVYTQHIPNQSSLIGVHVYSQWVLAWLNYASEFRLMFSEGLDIEVWQ